MTNHLPYTQDISRSLSDKVEKGLDRTLLDKNLASLKPFIQGLQTGKQEVCSPLLKKVGETTDIEGIEKAVDAFAVGATHLVILGTGGSGLGTAAIAQIASYNLPFTSVKDRIAVHVFDNLDAETFDLALTQLPIETTRFLAVSKSGGTLETMAQTTLAIQVLKEKNLSPKNHVFVITEHKPNSMRKLAETYDLPTADHPTDIGGRFAVLTLVGMIPAQIISGNARAYREGANAVVQNLLKSEDLNNIPSAVGASLAMGLEQSRGITSHVCMAYGDKFERFTAWARQLWAESLGKEGRGSLFVPAIGPVDQHSQVQLYRDGPADKSYTLFMTDTKGKGRVLTGTHDEANFGYIKGRTIGDIVDAEARATADALVSRNLPVRMIHCPQWDAYTMGALMMHYMLETIFMAELMQINAYDQPAVEDGKIIAKEYLQAMA